MCVYAEFEKQSPPKNIQSIGIDLLLEGNFLRGVVVFLHSLCQSISIFWNLLYLEIDGRISTSPTSKFLGKQKSPSDAPSKKFLLAPYVRSNSRPLLQEHDDHLWGGLQVIRGGGSAGAIPKQTTKLNHPIFQLVLTHTSMMVKGFRRWLAFCYDRENIPKKKKKNVSVKLHVFVVNSNRPPANRIHTWSKRHWDPAAKSTEKAKETSLPDRFERSSSGISSTESHKAPKGQMVSTKGVFQKYGFN